MIIEMKYNAQNQNISLFKDICPICYTRLSLQHRRIDSNTIFYMLILCVFRPHLEIT